MKYSLSQLNRLSLSDLKVLHDVAKENLTFYEGLNRDENTPEIDRKDIKASLAHYKLVTGKLSDILQDALAHYFEED